MSAPGSSRGDTPGAAAHHPAWPISCLASYPDLKPVRLHAAPCVTTFTRHGYPYIGWISGSDRRSRF